MSEAQAALPVVRVWQVGLGMDAWQVRCSACGVVGGAPNGWDKHWMGHNAASVAAARHLDRHREASRADPATP